MKKDKRTRQQLNSLDKDIWITLLLDMQDPILQQTIAIEKLTEQIVSGQLAAGEKGPPVRVPLDNIYKI